MVTLRTKLISTEVCMLKVERTSFAGGLDQLQLLRLCADVRMNGETLRLHADIWTSCNALIIVYADVWTIGKALRFYADVRTSGKKLRLYADVWTSGKTPRLYTEVWTQGTNIQLKIN